MSETDANNLRATEDLVAPDSTSSLLTDAIPTPGQQRYFARRDTRRWWINLLVQPALSLACGVILLVGLGVAQRLGLISSGSSRQSQETGGAADKQYICPMMCTPPQMGPGRCPVCAMELVPATSGGENGASQTIQIDPAARRVANIRTVAVASMPMTRTIHAIGGLSYDERTLKTISAYVEGRLDRLYADFTGVDVKKGDHLALVYSPRLYAAQSELLLARKAREQSRSATLSRVAQSSSDLYENSRQRLIELGMTELQIEQLEIAGEANSRMHLCAPISGTVIEKLAVEGQYVKEGQAIYKLADLSTVWLMLELFPEDAATIRCGQQVQAEVQSFPGRTFTGRVAFMEPNVDPKTRTVGVRVVIPNEDGLLRVGDYAKARIDVPASPSASADQDSTGNEALVVPRNAVLMAGNNSVVYVETEPGRFEIRHVVLGPNCGDRIVIRSGVTQGERVATRGNFLIDSQMQLAGNPSLIDPSRLQPLVDEEPSAERIATLSELSPEDRALCEKQRICPVTGVRLGSMGTPRKVDIHGMPVFICCEGCRESLLSEPEKYLAKLAASPLDEPARRQDPTGTPPLDLPPIGVPQIIELEQRELETAEEATRRAGTPSAMTERFGETRREATR